MLKTWIYGFSLCVLASAATLNSNDDVEVRLLDNQNAPLVATLDMSKANERVKQFVSDTIETKMKNIEETVKSKQFVNGAIEAKIKNIEDAVQSMKFVSDSLETNMKYLEVNLKTQTSNIERNLTDQLTDYIKEMVGIIAEENEILKDTNQRPSDCTDLELSKGNGMYKIYPKHSNLGFYVYCDLETDNVNGGWTVFQRRLNGKTDFYRDWETYENGFGNLKEEFWLGNTKMHTLTTQGKYELRVDISDFDGNTAYATYSTFSVGNASTNYKLSVAGYRGNAGDSLEYHNGQAFTTKDRDNDPYTDSNYKKNCGILRQGAWWYNNCAHSNLNGVYMKGGQNNHEGITWRLWKSSGSDEYSMKSSSMMLRRL